jgi:hypothetical protein
MAARGACVAASGLLSGTDREASRLDAIWRGLNEAGYVEGHNVAIEYRWAEGHNERLADIARSPCSTSRSDGGGGNCQRPVVLHTNIERGPPKRG